MDEIDGALDRLERATDRLERALLRALREPAGRAAAGPDRDTDRNADRDTGGDRSGDRSGDAGPDGTGDAGGARRAALADERDRLAAEVARLRAASEREAELRHEAAAAVKAALADLRALMPEGKAHG